jgi:hypothetical protein
MLHSPLSLNTLFDFQVEIAFRENQHIAYVGLDPGESGGAWIWVSSLGHINCRFSKYTEREICTALFALASNTRCTFCLEKVRASPQMGVTSAFTFGWNYGYLRGAVLASTGSLVEVLPQAWQKALNIPPRKKTETKGQFKKRLQQFAKELFPNIQQHISSETADALLICYYLSLQQQKGA